MNLMEPMVWLLFGYPSISIITFPAAYWHTRNRQVRMDNAHAYTWGWTAALVDALILAIFWPIWIFMFIFGGIWLILWGIIKEVLK